MELAKLQEGALCQLKVGRWDASTRMDKSKLGKNVPKEIVRAMQNLVDEGDKHLLDDLTTIRRQSKRILINNSLPFPVDGVFWVPKEQISLIDRLFNEQKVEYAERLVILKRHMPLIKRRFNAKYPDYYNADLYPKTSDLDAKYYFKWNFFHFVIPDREAEILSPAMYKREREKFKNMVKEMEEMTVNLIGNQLMQRITSLQSQCETGDISGATINSLDRFLDKWKKLWEGNIDNAKMKQIVKSLRVQMKRTTTEKLKDSEDFRNKAGAKLEKLIHRIKNIPNVELKRKFDI